MKGYQIPVHHQDKPGWQHKIPDPKPVSDMIPNKEGASSLIVYLDSEEKDAQETKQHVEKYGAKCFLFPTDLRKKENCKAVIDKAVEQLGGIDILVNNAAFQNMLPDIKDLTEYR